MQIVRQVAQPTAASSRARSMRYSITNHTDLRLCAMRNILHHNSRAIRPSDRLEITSPTFLIRRSIGCINAHCWEIAIASTCQNQGHVTRLNFYYVNMLKTGTKGLTSPPTQEACDMLSPLPITIFKIILF